METDVPTYIDRKQGRGSVKTRYRVLVLENPPNYFNKILQLVKQKFVCRHFTMEMDVPTYMDRKQGGGSVVYKNYEYSKVLLNFRDQTRTNVFNKVWL